MKHTQVIAGLIITGFSVQAQVLILSDSFSTGGVVTNDLNYNLTARQGGIAATKSISASAGNYASSLTSTGKLNVKTTLNQTDALTTDSFGTEIGNGSFRVRWKAQHDAAAANWSMMSVLSDANSDWNASPMTVNLWHIGFVHLDYGSGTNLFGDGTNLRIDLSPATIASAIGDAYDPTSQHEFEIRASAKSTTHGTWSFYIDGNAVSAGLPYSFADTAKKMSWWSSAGTDCNWDDLDISTISTHTKEYLFFDSFNGPDSSDANWLYGNRQTNGVVVSPYANSTLAFNITSNKLHGYTQGTELSVQADFASDLAGHDFKLSCKVAVLEDTSEWTSFYLYDETAADRRADSRLGMYVPDSSEAAWACVLYYGTSAGQDSVGVGQNIVETKLGLTPGSYNLADEHTFQFISTAGTGGTNSYILTIDGAIIKPSDVGVTLSGDTFEYYFDGAERHIGILNNTPTDITKGAFYDDIYLKVSKEITYENWAKENDLLGSEALRSADLEPDGMNNLLEYALGGDPNFDDAATILPTSGSPDGLAFKYVFRRRVDAVLRGLTYDLQYNTDLISSPWLSTEGTNETGYSTINSEFDMVTNSFDATGTPTLFLNLEITEN